MNLDALTEAVWQRLYGLRPRALLIGEPPEDYHKYNYVNEKPYEAIIIGRLPPGQLLHMPNDAVCEALLEGVPVFLYRGNKKLPVNRARVLWQELRKAEQYLLRLGVEPLERNNSLITADRARRLAEMGKCPPSGSRITPLAKDVLEGRET